MKYLFHSPLFLILSTKPNGKKYHLNLNQYRNWHFQVSNNLKRKYLDVMETQMSKVTFDSPIRLIFTLHRPDKRRVDRSNILCIHEKFFCDALTHYKCIKDDNDQFIVETVYRTGCIDKTNPRVDIQIEPIGN